MLTAYDNSARSLPRGRFALIIAAAVGVTILIAASANAYTSQTGGHIVSHSAGDPGDRVMSQLSPLAAVIPGYGTSRLPLLESIPWPFKNFMVEIEPAWDSCDGRAGTYGWDPVTVEAGFSWNGTRESLFALLDRRLLRIGWINTTPNKNAGLLGGYSTWSGALPNGRPADINVSVLDDSLDNYIFTASSAPVGKSVSEC
jgi:hypothetical protein